MHQAHRARLGGVPHEHEQLVAGRVVVGVAAPSSGIWPPHETSTVAAPGARPYSVRTNSCGSAAASAAEAAVPEFLMTMKHGLKTGTPEYPVHENGAPPAPA